MINIKILSIASIAALSIFEMKMVILGKLLFLIRVEFSEYKLTEL
jgi:hypothetical protein